MEQDLNRIKLVLVEKKKTGKWLAQELGVSDCKTAWCRNERAVKKLNQVLLQTKTLK